MKGSGFTLIEVMITLAIIAMLTAIALPSYNQYVVRSKVSTGIQTLATTKVTMDQFYQNSGSFNVGTTATCGSAAPAATTDFTYACTAAAETYTVTMTGLGNLSVYAFTIDEKGQKKTTANPKGTSATCWVMPNGDCQ